MDNKYKHFSFIKDIPEEAEKPYLIYKRDYITDIQDIVEISGPLEDIKINSKYVQHMLKAIKNEDLLNSLHENTKGYLENIFSKAVLLAVLTGSEISIYLSKEGEYAVVDISNYILDIFYPELFMLENLTINASEIMISNKSEREDRSNISFYFDFEDTSLNIVNSIRNKLSNI